MINSSQNVISPTQPQPDFAEGFKRILSAMYAHMSNDVLAATMAHFLLYQFLGFSCLDNNRYQQQKKQETKLQKVLNKFPLIIKSNYCWKF